MGFNAKGSLISLVYVSSGRQLSSEEIVEILRVSRANNQRDGITGLLAYKDGNFLQVLEGPEEVINNIVQRIERDSRHSGMIVLSKKPVKERLFGDWSMAFRDLKDMSPEEASAYSPLLEGALLDEKIRTRPEVSYKLLMSFRQSIR